MSAIRATTLTVRFLLELGPLAALAFWGFTVGHATTAVLRGSARPS